MMRSIWSRRLLKYAALPLGTAVVLYVAWVALQGLGTANICLGIGLLLFMLYMVDLKRAESRTDRNFAQRIRAEFAADDQPELFELYDRLKAKELEYRGVFLKRYEPFLGKWLSLLVTALAFSLSHIQVAYVASTIQFVALLFPFALVWGWMMEKTDSLWGSVLFQAGGDCMIIFAIYASLAMS